MGRSIGRDKYRRDLETKHEDRVHHSARSVSPPSRHLWAGGLSTRITFDVLYDKFQRFGDLENLAFVPGRSYAFVNFKRVEDAVFALKNLQGVFLDGSPLKIEFAKGDKPSGSSRNEDYPQDNFESHSIKPADSFSYKEARWSRSSPERPPETFKRSRSAEPSEMLWVGFPTYLDIDEIALRRAFAPFGEIEKISGTPGRNYAFVRYTSIDAACRAKEALDMKLFGNPRVHVRFARSDTNLADHGDNFHDFPFSPPFRSKYHPDSSSHAFEYTKRERNFDRNSAEFNISSPRLVSKFDSISGDPSFVDFGQSTSLRKGGAGSNVGAMFASSRLQELVSRSRVSEEALEHSRGGPASGRDLRWHDLPIERRRGSPFEDNWSSRDGATSAKKLKADPFPDKELPEYPFTDFVQEKPYNHLQKGLHSNGRNVYNRDCDSLQFGYKGFLDDPWKASDAYSGSDHGLLPEIQKYHPEFHQPPLNEEWRWVGMIAKGGTPVCRAKCLPVGKVLDFMLPEIVDCTARTGLDMLSKHYYQAVKSWVVFFVPESDADMSYYNEFMHYLEEKQRAAVAKLGEKITLFLVPPSEFSQKVLKVAGKMSISGVILKFDHPSSNFSSFGNSSFGAEFEHLLTQRPRSPIYPSSTLDQNYFSSVVQHLPPPPPTLQKPQDSFPYSVSSHQLEKLSDFNSEGKNETLRNKNPSPQSNWSAHLHGHHSSNSGHPQIPVNFDAEEKYPTFEPRIPKTATPGNYNLRNLDQVSSTATKPPSQPEPKPLPSSSLSLPLQPDQLAQLAVLLGQRVGSDSVSVETGQQLHWSGNPAMAPHGPSSTSVSVGHYQMPPAPVSPGSSGLHASSALSYSGVLNSQLPHASGFSNSLASSVVSPPDPAPQIAQKLSGSGVKEEEEEADPQKRLQATLQLAAALLQQIQRQGKS